MAWEKQSAPTSCGDDGDEQGSPLSPGAFRVVSWNINGVRASSVSLKELFRSLDADVICLQETKVTRDLLDEEVASVPGYNSYFAFSRKRSGYSGVATYCRDGATPFKAEEGLSGLLPSSSNSDAVGCYGTIPDEFDQSDLRHLDAEGRAVVTQHKFQTKESQETLSIINVYCPRADQDNPERLEFKLRFYQLVQRRAEALIESGSHVIILGDINTSHTRLDHCDPREEFDSSPSRRWMDELLSGQFIDTFRYLHPKESGAFTCWCTYLNARENNYGTRLDYIIADKKMTSVLEESIVLRDVLGSDHCPVQATFRFRVVKAEKCPRHCTKFFSEFSGRQQSLVSMFSQANKRPSVQGVRKSPAKKQKLSANCSAKQQDISKFFFRKVTNKNSSGVCDSKTGSQLSTCDMPNADLETITDISPVDGVENPLQLHPDSTANPIPDSQSSTDSSVTCSEFSSGANLEESDSQEEKGGLAAAWKMLMTGPKSPPKCKGHGEACVLRTVKKKGPNFNRQFWSCPRGVGHSSNADASCNFFQWLKAEKAKKKK